MDEDKKPYLTEEDKKILERIKPEGHQRFKFFPGTADLDERPWILRNLWWILIIVGAILISLLV